MNRHCERIWFKFEQDIIAVNESGALALLFFLRQSQRMGISYTSMEIIDLQRYKLVTKKNMVRSMLHLSEKDKAFIFPVCKN